jgi:hypothetical protein
MSAIAAAAPTTRRILRAATRAAAAIAILGATACIEPPTAPRQLERPDDSGGVLMPPRDGAWTSWDVAKQGTATPSGNAARRREGSQP